MVTHYKVVFSITRIFITLSAQEANGVLLGHIYNHSKPSN